MVGAGQGVEVLSRQLLLFTEAAELSDKDGDKIIFNPYTDKTNAICYFLKCTKTKAIEVQKELEKEYQIFTCSFWQIVLAKENRIVYNFEINGETWFNGHKYNTLNEWAFRKLVEGIKPKEKKPPKPKVITVTSTERQLRKAKQLWYAKTIGFNITSKDYIKWHLL